MVIIFFVHSTEVYCSFSSIYNLYDKNVCNIFFLYSLYRRYESDTDGMVLIPLSIGVYSLIKIFFSADIPTLIPNRLIPERN
jgi:hypothetical protein